ncbi:prolyl oligopeptidase family serine peptidase [Bacillus massilinigeriensis]|uniref:prolyl oligopeptidase family serine peptidase n=1 Tax=Bacillus mediterraneensis TaxID=1805474 RepID=UPI0008F9670F|nr:prolyl oligopeptidase family serine peptidase [Bacillus mediterraneensis]
MIAIEKISIDNIPVLHVVKQDSIKQLLPTVFFLHGFTSTKETNLNYAYLMAEKGLRVVLPEALYHGERGGDKTDKELGFSFWEIVLNNIKELESLKNYFTDKGLTDSAKIGVAGTSMGAITTLGALKCYEWISSAVSLMGSPAFRKLAEWQIAETEKLGISLPFTEEQTARLLARISEYDISLHPEKLSGRPLLFWHGKLDSVVPYEGAEDFFEEVKEDYKSFPEKLQFISDSHAGHKVSKTAIRQTAEWFELHLNRQ